MTATSRTDSTVSDQSTFTTTLAAAAGLTIDSVSPSTLQHPGTDPNDPNDRFEITGTGFDQQAGLTFEGG